jgi:hypothetical protein
MDGVSMKRFKQILREPLTHFLLIGLALFILFEMTRVPGDDAPRRIVVDTSQVAQLTAQFKRTWMRPPTQAELDGLIELVNRTWERRAEIPPDHELHQRPTPMAVFRLLPQTNCKECGEPTCFSFALKLTTSQKALSDCQPLHAATNAEKLLALQAIVIEAPAIE